MFKARLSLAVLLLLVLPAHTHAEEAEDDGRPMQPTVLEMSGAAVLASPGTPTALQPFLPRGEAPQRLTWPLPEQGALLVLALPRSDPLAQRLADIFQLQVDTETLAGGYAIHAWQSGGRNIVLLFGADTAALQAARFEFDASAPMEMIDPSMRSLDFKRPNQEAAVLVRTGTRVVRPRYATRALDVPGSPPRDLVATLAGARANRVWIDDAHLCSAPGRRLARELEAHGIVAVHRMDWDARESRSTPPNAAADVEAYFSSSEADVPRRHVALVFNMSCVDAVLGGETHLAYEAEVVRLLAQRLRPHLQELIVVPRAYSDDLARCCGAPPDLRGIPEAVLAWSGPLEYSTTITRADAERRVREVGVPVVLVDTWTAPFPDDRHIPSLPTGRAADLGDVLEGVVVRGIRGTDALLESAWDASATERFGVDLLTPLVPRKEQDTLELLRIASVRLDHAAKENLGLVPWMAPLATDLRTVQAPVQRIPLLRDTSATDAGVFLVTPDGLRVRALSDGSALYLRVFLPRSEVKPPNVRLTLSTRGESWQLDWTEGKVGCSSLVWGRLHPMGRGHVLHSRRMTPNGVEVEWRLDRFALGGDAHELRHFAFCATRDGQSLWPKSGDAGTLVVLKP